MFIEIERERDIQYVEMYMCMLSTHLLVYLYSIYIHIYMMYISNISDTCRLHSRVF